VSVTFEIDVAVVVVVAAVAAAVAFFKEVTFFKEFMVLDEAVDVKVTNTKVSVILRPNALVALFLSSKLRALVC
jgi:hypothetical protein